MNATTAAAATARAAPPDGVQGIAWFEGSVDAAFAEAKRSNKPLFLFWGAVWCPPCNQVKATLFNRQDFIARTRAFVPVYIDGDAPNAQRLAARFKVNGYPTMVLFRPDGREITRLPGEVDGTQYLEALTLGISTQRSVQELIALLKTSAKNTARGADFKPQEWRLLAYYAWESDEQAAVPNAQRPALLMNLAQACPALATTQEAADRLWLKALGAVAAAPDRARPVVDTKQALQRVQAVLRDPARTRAQFSALIDSPSAIVTLLAAQDHAERSELLQLWEAALREFAYDTSLSRTDQLYAHAARLDLARLLPLQQATAPGSALSNEIRNAALQADRATSNRFERQSVINAAAYVLREAGLMSESDTLLKTELQRSPAPYYFMLGLASNARQRGDTAQALDWHAQAYQAAQGPATRLQWGASYVRALIDLTPHATDRIAAAAQRVFDELPAQPEAFAARNAAVLQRLGQSLTRWEHSEPSSERSALLERLRRQVDAMCARLSKHRTEHKRCTTALHRNG